MLFDFKAYIEELRDNNEKKEIVEKYEKHFGPIDGDIKDQIWYKEYCSKFDTLPFKVSDELKTDFDWDVLMQLVASSLSSEGLLDVENKEEGEFPEFVISVQSGDQVVVKKISELWGFQILRLYEIYVEEQMNLQILITEDEKEKEAIVNQRDSRENRWKLVMDNLKRKQMEVHEQEEKKEKLDDLMSQL